MSLHDSHNFQIYNLRSIRFERFLGSTQTALPGEMANSTRAIGGEVMSDYPSRLRALKILQALRNQLETQSVGYVIVEAAINHLIGFRVSTVWPIFPTGD
jgi:hypothetical protein